MTEAWKLAEINVLAFLTRVIINDVGDGVPFQNYSWWCRMCSSLYLSLYNRVSVSIYIYECIQYVWFCRGCLSCFRVTTNMCFCIFIYSGLSASVIVCLCLIAQHSLSLEILEVWFNKTLQSIWKFRCMVSGYKLKPWLDFLLSFIQAFFPTSLLPYFIMVSSHV